jgi:hypothetical protein
MAGKLAMALSFFISSTRYQALRRRPVRRDKYQKIRISF